MRDSSAKSRRPRRRAKLPAKAPRASRPETSSIEPPRPAAAPAPSPRLPRVIRTPDHQFFYDPERAERVVEFFYRYLRHSKGEWAGQPIRLEPWQAGDHESGIIRPLFGWRRYSDGKRRYRKLYAEIPRKNGKSTKLAGIGNYMLGADNEPGAEVYSAAADKEQAGIVFNQAVEMVNASPALSKRYNVYKTSIAYLAAQSYYRVLSSIAMTKHGLNPHCNIVDELHAHKSRDLYDALTTGSGSRSQPLTAVITTAGYDRNSVCWEEHEYARKVIAFNRGDTEQGIEDPELLPIIYAADEGDDWQDPKTWAKANPNLGISLKLDYLVDRARKAAQIPAFENIFKRYHLNMWTEQDARWLPMHLWDSCAGEVVTSALEGLPCWGGLDLASTTDIAALVLDFVVEGRHAWLPFFWIPDANMKDRIRKDRVPYDVWVKKGFVKVTKGNVIDYSVIMEDIRAIREVFDLREIAFDPWNATQVTTDLAAEGVTVVPMRQGFASMSAPTKEFYKFVLEKRIQHGSNPVLRWMASNVVVSQDAAGNLKPNKAKSTARIDGIVAGIMAFDRAIRNGGAVKKSVYSRRGIRTL